MTDLNFPNAVTDEKDFYGRQVELRQIEETFHSDQRVPVLVIGERRTGKTSLMNVAVRRLQSYAGTPVQPRFAYLPVEPRGITTFNAFARAVLLQMSAYLWKSWPDMSLEDDQHFPDVETIEQFEILFTNLLRYSVRETFLVCIDEFDEIIRQTGPEELPKVFGMIYHLVEKTQLPIAFFFTMTSVPDTMKEERPSSLIAMSQVIDLAPLEGPEVARMVADISAARICWPEECFQQLFRTSGGNPYLTKLLLAHLLAICPRCTDPALLTSALLEEAVREALCDPRTDHVFENLYKVHFSAQEREFLLLLARRPSPVPARDLTLVAAVWNTVARRLVKRHYVVDGPGGYVFRASFTGEWLRGWIAFEEECAQYNTLQARLSIPKEIEVNVITGQVMVMGIPVKLSPQEFAIMDFLSECTGRLVRREELVDRVWGTDQGVSDQVIDTAFYRLRKKIGDQGQYIETIPGQGFRLHRSERISGPARRPRGDQKGGLA